MRPAVTPGASHLGGRAGLPEAARAAPTLAGNARHQPWATGNGDKVMQQEYEQGGMVSRRADERRLVPPAFRHQQRRAPRHGVAWPEQPARAQGSAFPARPGLRRHRPEEGARAIPYSEEGSVSAQEFTARLTAEGVKSRMEDRFYIGGSKRRAGRRDADRFLSNERKSRAETRPFSSAYSRLTRRETLDCEPTEIVREECHEGAMAHCGRCSRTFLSPSVFAQAPAGGRRLRHRLPCGRE